jgi:hypothetical protein
MFMDYTRDTPTILPSNPLKSWFNSIFSMAFYVAVFSGIGYFIHLTLL